MRNILLIALASVLLTACSGGSPDAGAEPRAQVSDSAALRVAVFPSSDALPLLLASDWGIYEELGIPTEIAVYRSQMDAEKALADGKADAVLTDKYRIEWWQRKGSPIQYAFSTRRPLYMVPNKQLRITRIDQLDDRMIAGSRYSLDDQFADQAVAQIKKRKGQILRPQINSVELRLSMLTSGQLDAAVLNTLQALKAKAAGYSPLTIPEGLTLEGAVAYSTRSRHARKLPKLQRAYQQALQRLRRSATMPQVSTRTREALFLTDGIDTLLNAKTDF
ncbi:MAG: ABC transporter substrate-binding protein [Bacteroidaceae bacterium]|nr:ABC transporter substrate-binding protein [Bacteroidaceae bacterium]